MTLRNQLGELLEEQARRKARNDFATYCRAVMPTFEVAPHHALMIRKSRDVEKGNQRRVMISCPPRHGKSTTMSHLFPCWYLGRNPTKKVMIATYAQDLANDLGRKVLRTLTDQRHLAIFPRAEVDQNAASQSRIDLVAGGAFYALGRGGALTGRGADLLVADDLFRDGDEVRSLAVRKQILDWYSGVALSRLSPDAAIMLIGTRWGRGDLFDHLLEELGEKGWDVVNLPALAEANDLLGRAEGDALWPEKFSREVLLERRAETAASVWTCLYQGQPAAAEGVIVRREWLQSYNTAPETKRVIFSLDTAFKSTNSADYSVLQIWGEANTGFYLLHSWRGRAEFPALKKILIDFYDNWRPHFVLIEDAASGQSLLQELRVGTSLPCKPIRPDHDKTARLTAVTPILETGRVFIPTQAPWLDDFVSEVCGFPNLKHDDQVDALTQALSFLRGRGALHGLLALWKQQAEDLKKLPQPDTAQIAPQVVAGVLQPATTKKDVCGVCGGERIHLAATFREPAIARCLCCGLEGPDNEKQIAALLARRRAEAREDSRLFKL